MSTNIKIAIDGPAAAGKSTVAKITAKKLGYTYIDTGAMYRALTHKAIQQGIDTNDAISLEELLKDTEITLIPTTNGQAVYVDRVDVSEDIRTQQVTQAVSAASVHKGVRQLMVEKQRKLADQDEMGVVMDGRDIGTHVLPDAELKIFMTATVEERARRRHEENTRRGILSTLEQLQNEITERDRIDSEREIAPLQQAADAVLLDTTSMTIEEVSEEIRKHAEMRIQK